MFALGSQGRGLIWDSSITNRFESVTRGREVESGNVVRVAS